MSINYLTFGMFLLELFNILWMFIFHNWETWCADPHYYENISEYMNFGLIPTFLYIFDFYSLNVIFSIVFVYVNLISWVVNYFPLNFLDFGMHYLHQNVSSVFLYESFDVLLNCHFLKISSCNNCTQNPQSLVNVNLSGVWGVVLIWKIFHIFHNNIIAQYLW